MSQQEMLHVKEWNKQDKNLQNAVLKLLFSVSA